LSEGSSPPFSALPGSWVSGNSALDTTSTNLQAGTLFPYLRSINVFRCPSDKTLTNPRDGKRFPVTRSYNVNAMLNAEVGNLVPVPPRPFVYVQKFSSLVTPPPSQVWVFTEPGPYGTGEAVFGFYITQPLPHER
jgi:hypothetical protein